jgi:hypothetical protein
MGFIWLSEQTQTNPLNNIKDLIYVMEMQCFLLGRRLIFKYYLDEFQASTLKTTIYDIIINQWTIQWKMILMEHENLHPQIPVISVL